MKCCLANSGGCCLEFGFALKIALIFAFDLKKKKKETTRKVQPTEYFLDPLLRPAKCMSPGGLHSKTAFTHVHLLHLYEASHWRKIVYGKTIAFNHVCAIPRKHA